MKIVAPASSIFDHPMETLDWFEETLGEMFLAQIQQWLIGCQHQLEKESDPNEIYRLQGEISAYRSILNIPDDVRRLQEDKKLGKRS